jgi:pimeloyl-ACP methyl ester carboxylesterase
MKSQTSPQALAKTLGISVSPRALSLPGSPDAAFQSFLTKYSEQQKALLMKNKTMLLEQCHDRLALPHDQNKYSPSESRQVLSTLEKMIFSCAHIPEGLITHGDQLEKDQLDKDNNVIDFDIPARNLLRHLVRGTEIKESDCKHSLAFVQHALEKEKHEGLLKSLRVELKNILLRIADRVIPDEKDEKQKPTSVDEQKNYEILVSNLLAAYPFIDPVEDESIIIPQRKPSGGWKRVEYKINKIDLSPQTGLLSWLLKDKDRIYAYGMAPKADKEAESQLSLMGTTYTSGQGAWLSGLRNFNPDQSVGEGHDMTNLDKWMKNQAKVKVTGHSQGGTLAMIVAATHHDKVTRADCLNPTALANATLERLNPAWLKLADEKKPAINVYAQQGDPVYPLENGFLKGTRLLRVIPGSEKSSSLKWYIPKFIQKATEAHLHHIAGRDSSLIIEMDADKENFTSGREFRANMKGAINRVLYPFMYLDLVSHLATRNAKEWCIDNLPKAVTYPAAIIGAIPYYATKFVVDKIATPAIKFPVLIVSLLLTALYSGASIGIKKLANLFCAPSVSAKLRSDENNNCSRYPSVEPRVIMENKLEEQPLLTRPVSPVAISEHGEPQARLGLRAP